MTAIPPGAVPPWGLLRGLAREPDRVRFFPRPFHRQDRAVAPGHRDIQPASVDPAPSASPHLQSFQILLLVALWIATRSYAGIIHDGRLYLAQALHKLQPGQLAGDLFFQFGSQDSFTVFSAPYAWLVAAVGIGPAHFVTMAAGHGCWIFALLFLLRRIFGDARSIVLAAAGVILLNPYYGNLEIFSYGEPFATPRLFAEAGVMVGLAFALRGRIVVAAICLIGAASLHPLLALPGIGVLAIMIALRDRRFWVLYGVGVATALALASAGIEPFARVFMTFDPVWFKTVFQRCAFAFLTGWTWGDLLAVCPTLVAVVIAWFTATPAERRLLGLIGAVAVAGLAATLVGADLARDVLVTNLQPWRALWLLTLVGNAWMAVILLRLPAATASRQFLFIAVVADAFERWLLLTPLASSVAFAIVLLAFLRERQTGRALSRPVWIAGAAAMVLVAISLPVETWFVFPIRAEITGAAPLLESAAIILAVVATLILTTRTGWRASAIGSGLAVVLLLGTISLADHRTAWQSYIEDETVPDDLRNFVAGENNVYWEDGVELLWLKLKKPSYYSCLQGTGAMFFAGTAREYQRRTDALARLNTADFDGPDVGTGCGAKQLSEDGVPPTRDDLAASCRALPDLDAIVLTTAVQGTRMSTWTAPARLPIQREGKTRYSDTFFKYRCSDLR